jgi:hypothetical protein
LTAGLVFISSASPEYVHPAKRKAGCEKQLEKGGAFQEILSLDLEEDELRTVQNL